MIYNLLFIKHDFSNLNLFKIKIIVPILSFHIIVEGAKCFQLLTRCLRIIFKYLNFKIIFLIKLCIKILR